MFRQSCYVHALIVLHVVITLQQSIGVPCLTIDNRLTHAANDCYTRLLIGTKIPDGDIALRTDVASLTECEENCTKYRNGCSAFSFGVGVRGNSTCLISTRIPPSENFEVHPDYDVYMKRQDSARYYFDRFYGALYRQSANAAKEVKQISEKSTALNTSDPFSELVPSSISVSIPRYTLLSSSDGKRFLSAEYNRKSQGISTVKDERTTSASPSVANCHRRMQAGKKMMEVFIERIINCGNLQDCCRSCDYEVSFVCKGFNHRSDDSKCTCELTSTPYFRMNVDEDFLADSQYDYYEKNHNCLPSVWHGNVGKPNLDNRNRDFGQSARDAWLNLDRIHKDIPRELSTGTLRDYFFNGRAQPSDRSNYEYPFDFTPRHDALNWNRSWKSSVPRYTTIVNQNSISNRQINHHNEYLDAKYPIVSNGQLGDRDWIRELSIPNEKEQFHEQFYNYGKAYDYREIYVPITMEPPHEKHENLHRCSFKAISGTRLSRSVVRKTCFAHDFDLCEDFCINETRFSCESFAYRYSASTSNPTDNCLLSNLSYRDLNFYTDLEPDRDYDSYVIATSVESCNLKESKVGDRYPLEECFVRIKSGFTIPMAVTKKSLSVNNLGDCQLACTTSGEFFCKCFVYKYAATIPPSHTHEHVSPNCFLSDWPTEEIHSIDMPDMDGGELYERNTYSFGCEVHSSPIPIPNVVTRNDGVLPSTHIDELCYSKHHGSCKLMSHAIVVSMRVATISECRRRCTMMRYTGTIPCMSFNYISPTTTSSAKNTTTTTSTSTPNMATTFDDVQDNCFISEISMQDLRPNLDYVHNGDHTLYTWADYDPRCRLMINTLNTISVIPVFDKENQAHIPASYPNNPVILNAGVSTRASNSDPSTRWKSKFRPKYNDDRYLKYSSVNENSTPPQDSASHPQDGYNFLYSRSQFSPFQRYTVNGHPCKNGTVCQRNKISGFWSCEIEPEYGSWDYCCQPNHRCGFSKGYRHPWCYVGSNEDQWRPCSETYYPYYFSKDHSIYNQSAFDTGRHWPVIYFHQVPPPNCSTHDDYYKKL